jgi:hypothetical protein
MSQEESNYRDGQSIDQKSSAHMPNDKSNVNDREKQSDLDKSPSSTAQDSEPNVDFVYPKGLQLFAIVVALCIGVLLVALDQTIIATAIPRITDRFNSVQDIGWYGSVRVDCLGFGIDVSNNSP